MSRHWRGIAGKARRHSALRGLANGAIAGIGGAIGIGAMQWLSQLSHYPLAIVPFATSIVLVIGAPDAEPAQPRAVIGGHVVASVVGLAVLKLTGAYGWAAATAVGLAIIAMYLTDTFHPPAGINPLLVVSNDLPWTFLFVPVLAGAVLLTGFAVFWHRRIGRRPWPREWL
jgi:CBS-domain-containing membrane protein